MSEMPNTAPYPTWKRVLHFLDSWLGGGPPTGWFAPPKERDYVR